MPNPLDLLLKIARAKTRKDKWDGQPFQLIKVMPNTTKGDLAETFIMEYSKELGFDVVEKISRLGDYDATINGMTFEVKMATEDISGSFQFNHIRYDYKYDWIVCLGITPTTILFGIWSKSDLVTGKAGTLVSMGRGQNSSFKLTKPMKSLRPISEFKSRILSLTNP